MFRRYWSFYWPLTITGLSLLLARQCQNGTLARYPDAARELSIYAYATSATGVFNAALIFIPQMVNVLVRSRESQRACFRFTLATCAILSVSVSVGAYTNAARELLSAVFRLDPETCRTVTLYVRLLGPLVLVNGMRHYCTGLLVQCRRTGLVTALNIVFLAVMLTFLVVGYNLGWRALTALASAQIAAALVHLTLACVTLSKVYHPPDGGDQGPLPYRRILGFFWPVALTSVMFSFSRPILFFFVSRTGADAVVTVAALRVAFDFAMVFHTPINQFRHLVVTFGAGDRRAIQRFMLVILGGIVVLMALVAGTPLSGFILRYLLGVEGAVLVRSRQALWVLCLVPVVACVRNYFHGLALLEHRTRGMGLGGFMRNLAILTSALACYQLGLLNHVAAAAILVLGFAVETLTVVAHARIGERRQAGKPQHPTSGQTQPQLPHFR